jgi:hypothetical protein
VASAQPHRVGADAGCVRGDVSVLSTGIFITDAIVRTSHRRLIGHCLSIRPSVRYRLLDNPGHKLWVVHEIMYASKLVVTSSALTSATNKLPGVTEGGSSFSLYPITLPGSTNLKFPGKFMYAFRAIRFRFDATGEFVNVEDEGQCSM